MTERDKTRGTGIILGDRELEREKRLRQSKESRSEGRERPNSEQSHLKDTTISNSQFPGVKVSVESSTTRTKT